MAEPFIAEVRAFAFNFAPRGWAFCEGQLLPIAQNTALFSLIGTTYGGDGRTTTALPNLEDRAVMHAGSGPGLTPRRLGEKTGSYTVSLSEQQIPSHYHAAFTEAEQSENSTPAGNIIGVLQDAQKIGARTFKKDPPDLKNTTSSSWLQVTGGGQTHTNLQPLIGVIYCIALVGTYPSRS
ncbi:phage tail protein [Acanthopleuribacter pedis]|uniref:Phage tail protein n=1 Tax=Acanthopleuribacter pedis TaxID=442870 RepID=A0A8J7U6N9_9BACT|nr:tail fiber protein [Acanthopleuribacter pedis]MBO1322967.1 phage tail protein [Acanthopleuribacter pedis]